MKSYSELSRLHTFDERFLYASLDGSVGEETFGWERQLNQTFYKSAEWLRVRHHVIARDLGMDLGIDGYAITDRPIIHHLNPITKEDIYDRNLAILNPEFLITVSHRTHNAIHYGNQVNPRQDYVERRPGDTKLW